MLREPDPASARDSRWSGPRVRRLVTVTATLAALTAAASVALTLFGYTSEAAMGLGFIPARTMGTPLDPAIASLPVWLTPLGGTLVHVGVLQLFFDMAILLLVGNQVEKALGGWRMLLLYVLGAYAGAAAYLIEAPDAVMPMLGGFAPASALIGAYAMLYARATAGKRGGALLLHAGWLTGAWALLNVGLALAQDGSGLMPGWTANVGAFVLGVALARPMLAWRWRNA